MSWFKFDIDCVVPENMHTHPKEGHWKFQGGGGSPKSKRLKESMKLNFNFQGGGGGGGGSMGGGGGMDILWNHTFPNQFHFSFCLFEIMMMITDMRQRKIKMKQVQKNLNLK